MNPTLTFYGGAGGVTGSKHLLEIDGKRILFDCGTFQGLPDVRERNRGFPFPPESIDHVVLSHAHLDHCGMLPLLVKRGFTGSVFATEATRDVVRHMLEDSAGIEEQDAAYRQRHHVGSPDDREPLFTKEDIPAVMDRFVSVPYARDDGRWHDMTDSMRVKMYDAGHILGSSISVVEVDRADGPFRLAYTGDVGQKNAPVLPDPEVPSEEISHVIAESTYGKRSHVPLEDAIDRLVDMINEACDRDGKIIVPAFSLGRTQMFVYVIHKLIHEKRIPRFPVYVDSPLATNLTDVYKRHRYAYDPRWRDDFTREGDYPLSFRNLTYTQSVEESKRLNIAPGPFMVISASGMMTAGRVVHHLRHSISSPRNVICITGYQAEGTLGRRILEGAKRVELYGDWFDVRAQVHVFNELSAHADRGQMEEYLNNIPGMRNVILVHGEPSQADEFRQQLQKRHADWNVYRPHEGDTIELT